MARLVKLYNIPRNTWIKVFDPGDTPSGQDQAPDHGRVLFFKHMDGMYSLCKTAKGNICHVAAGTLVTEATPMEILEARGKEFNDK